MCTPFFCSLVTYLSRQIFLALDPISSMHMGLSNDPEEQYRAELMSHFILRKIPNNITEECEEVFQKGRESQKLQQTRKSQQLDAAATTQILQNIQQDNAVQPFGGQGDGANAAGALINDLPNNKIQRVNESTGGEGDGSVEIIDMENTIIPFENKTKPTCSVVTKLATQAVVPVLSEHSANTSTNTNAAAPCRGSGHSSELPVLRDLFCGAAYPRLSEWGLSSADALAAYKLIVQAGCSSTEDLVSFLDEHKQYRPCSCGGTGLMPSQGQSGSQDTGRRNTLQYSVLEALTSIRVPAFHAVKIVQALRTELK